MYIYINTFFVLLFCNSIILLLEQQRILAVNTCMQYTIIDQLQINNNNKDCFMITDFIK